jgi:hypothetical protein
MLDPKMFIGWVIIIGVAYLCHYLLKKHKDWW